MRSSGGGRMKAWAVQHRLAPYLFLMPFVMLFCGLTAYPLLRSAILSFETTAGPRQARFVGLGHFRFLLTDWLFWVAVANTFGFAIAFVGLQIPASLGLALLLNRPGVRGREFFRFVFFSANLVGQAFAAVLFALLLAPRQGLVNRALLWMLPAGIDTNWRSDARFARPAILLAALWLSVGYGMIYLLAALQAVERELYDAAHADGAGAWSRFWHVTLPGIAPVLSFLVLVGTIGSLSLFELPYVFFQGPGPGFAGLTIVEYLYEQGFGAGDLGFASAVAWVLVAMIGIVTFAELKWARRRGER